jgi:cell division protein FtsB
MAVRTQFPWWGRGVVATLIAAFIAGMWWWGFDFGQLFGGVNRRETQTRMASLEADTAALRTEATTLRARNSQLESEVAMARGTQEAIGKQAADLAAENAQLKEETAFLRQLLADTNKEPGMSIPRLAIERQGDDTWRYGLLIVRGGNPRDEFAGRLVLQATLQGADAGDGTTTHLTLPDDQPETAPVLKLAFKYYQRIEGTFRVPAGVRVTAFEARAFEKGSGSPRASRTVQSGLTNR